MLLFSSSLISSFKLRKNKDELLYLLFFEIFSLYKILFIIKYSILFLNDEDKSFLPLEFLSLLLKKKS